MSDRRGGAFMGGMILGAAIGAVTGLLIAPKSGRETRRMLKKSADALPDLVEDLSTTLHLHADRLSDSALQNWDETLDRLRTAIAAGKAASELEAETLSQSDRANSTAAAPSSDT